MKKRRQPQPGPCTLFLHAVVLHKIPKGVSAGSEVNFVIKQTVGDKKYKSSEKMPAILDKESGTITFDIQSKIVSLNEDCKFEFYHKTTVSTKKMFHFWFNTRFQKLEWAPTRERDNNGNDSGSEEEDDEDEEPDSDDESGAAPKKPPTPKTETKKVVPPTSPAKTTPAAASVTPRSSATTPAPGKAAAPATPAKTAGAPATAAASVTPRPSATMPVPAKAAPAQAPLSEKEQKKADKAAKKKTKDLSPAEKYSAEPPAWPDMIVYPNHPRIRFHKGQLDKAVKDKKHKKYHKDFQVEVIVTRTAMSTTVKAREVIEAEGSLPTAVAESRAASQSLKIVTSTPVSVTRPLGSQSISMASPAKTATIATATPLAVGTPAAAAAAKR